MGEEVINEAGDMETYYDEYIAKACAFRGISVDIIRSTMRTRKISHTRRWILVHFCRERCLGTREAAHLLNLANHTSAVTAMQQHDDAMRFYKDYRDEYNAFKNYMENGKVEHVTQLPGLEDFLITTYETLMGELGKHVNTTWIPKVMNKIKSHYAEHLAPQK